MGYSPGEFQDDQGREWHLEDSSGLIIFQNSDEMAPLMRLSEESAVKMYRDLDLLLKLRGAI